MKNQLQEDIYEAFDGNEILEGCDEVDTEKVIDTSWDKVIEIAARIAAAFPEVKA